MSRHARPVLPFPWASALVLGSPTLGLVRAPRSPCGSPPAIGTARLASLAPSERRPPSIGRRQTTTWPPRARSELAVSHVAPVVRRWHRRGRIPGNAAFEVHGTPRHPRRAGEREGAVAGAGVLGPRCRHVRTGRRPRTRSATTRLTPSRTDRCDVSSVASRVSCTGVVAASPPARVVHVERGTSTCARSRSHCEPASGRARPPTARPRARRARPHRRRRAPVFSATAARTSAVNAPSSSSSPSRRSIARRVLPSRLELNR